MEEQEKYSFNEEENLDFVNNADMDIIEDTNVNEKTKLTKREEFFCRHYVVHHNKIQAIKSAGYKAKNPAIVAHNLLQKEKIQKFITALEKPVLDKLGIDKNWVISKLKIFAETNITDFFDIVKENGKDRLKLKDIEDIDPDKFQAVESIKQTAKGIEIKLIDKRASVVDLGKYLGMFNENKDDNFKGIDEFLYMKKKSSIEQDNYYSDVK